MHMCDGSCGRSDCQFCKIHTVVHFACVALGIVHLFALVCPSLMIVRLMHMCDGSWCLIDCQFGKIQLVVNFAGVALGIAPLFALV